MNTIGQLKNKYKSFSDKKIEELALEGENLTDEAKIALEEEILNRDLDTSLLEYKNRKFIPEDEKIFDSNGFPMPAQSHQRFFNRIIDYFIFPFVMICLAYIIDHIIFSDTSFGLNSAFLIIISNFLFLETQYGKTIGKYITKTKALKLDGSALGFKDALLRTLLRIIPIDGIWLIYNGKQTLHDYLTETYVSIDVKFDEED